VSETVAVPTADQLRDRAKAKLTKAELQALRVELRREVKAEAKADRAPRVRELPEVASAARRMIRAVGERAGQDVEGLAELAQLRDAVDQAMTAAVVAARDPQRQSVPYSWADVGRVLGMTRQAAQQRFGRADVR
jgi:hypothetical protein